MLEKQSGYKVNWMTNGGEVEDSVLSYHYDIVIIDWMIPIISGVEVCRNLRNSGYTGAIIMVTAKDELQSRVQGLDAGADDYLVRLLLDNALIRAKSSSNSKGLTK